MAGQAGNKPMVCIPGKQEECACPGGTTGAQACKDDGSGYLTCICPEAAGGGGQGGISGAAGAGGGSAGSAGVAGLGGASGAGQGGAQGGQGGATSESTDALCSDGLDNDEDGFADCGDADCVGNPAITVCGSGAGGGGSGGAPGSESSPEACTDGKDNDGDLFLDCEDKDCCALVDCKTLAPTSYCGKGGGGFCSGKVVINELSAAHQADGNDDFVELYNPGDCVVDLTGWRLVYRSAAAPSLVELRWTAPSGTQIAAKGMLVLGTPSFTGTKQDELSAGLKQGGAGIALLDAKGTAVDRVAWGDVPSSHPDIEGQKCGDIPIGASASRYPDGTDTDNNKLDFKTPTPRTPGAPNAAK